MAYIDKIQVGGTNYDIQDSALKSAIPLNYVALKGENQVTPQNLEGMQFTKTTGEGEGDNIFSASMLFSAEHYVIESDGEVSMGGNTVFNAYCVPVDGESTYVFPECRFVLLSTGNTLGSPAVGTTVQYATRIDSTGANYLFLSYANTAVEDITVKPIITTTVYSDFILPEWLTDNLPLTPAKDKSKSVTGSLSDGEALIINGTRTNLRKGERVTFYADITSFNSITLGISVSDSTISNGTRNTFSITDSEITYCNYAPYSPQTVTHGLTIQNNIQIIGEEDGDATYKLTLISNGAIYEHKFNYVRQVVGTPFVSSSGSQLTNCKLSWTCNDIDKTIWVFGDSYVACSLDRWPYYMREYGYDQNCLIDGFPGEGSANAIYSLSTLLNYGTPRWALWCMGMNDGSDSNNTPSTDWANKRDIFITTCEQNNITPVFATIPTVPTINNESKNAWVRSSGYRYIDFAKAVGASSEGVWFSGMLSNDNVHPTENGARALFERVLVDFPEIMVGGYGTPTNNQ